MDNNSTQPNILGTEKIGRLLAKFAIPGIASMVINALYNIVDQIFIGQYVGYLGNAATNVVFPLTTFAMAFALMIGDGAASYMSLMLGKREEKKAAQGTVAGMIFIVVSGIFIALLYTALLPQLCRLFGATENVMPYALRYGGIISLGIPFCAVCAGYASIIRADGSPKYNMVGLITGCVLNLIGDPLFIKVFKLGVAGAAWATIIGQIANAIINFCYIPRIKSVKITRADIKPSIRQLGNVLKLGLSSFISQVALVVVIAVQNNIMRSTGAESVYGPDMPIAALGVTMKVFSILMVIVIGLAAGAQPIWGYNYGAKQYDRVKKTLKIVILFSTVVMFLALFIFQLFPMAVVSIFGSEDEVYNRFAKLTLRIFLMLVPFSGFQLVMGIFFQAVGKPAQASIISMSKQIIFSIPATIILAKLMGIEGVLWSGPVSDLLAFILSLVLLICSWKSIFGSESSEEGEQKKNSLLNSPYSRSQDGTSRLINGKPLVISIGRTYGSGGRTVGKLVAQKLNVPYYDYALIQEAADESGLSAMFLAFMDEKPLTAGAISSAAPSVANSSTDMSAIQQAAEEARSAVIQKVAAKGSCVIVGRRADQILKDKVPVFKVFVTKPLEQRIETVSARENLSPSEAEKLVRHSDKQRAAYYNESAPGLWGNAKNYNLCVDTGSMTTESAAELVVQTVLNM